MPVVPHDYHPSPSLVLSTGLNVKNRPLANPSLRRTLHSVSYFWCTSTCLTSSPLPASTNFIYASVLSTAVKNCRSIVFYNRYTTWNGEPFEIRLCGLPLFRPPHGLEVPSYVPPNLGYGSVKPPYTADGFVIVVCNVFTIFSTFISFVFKFFSYVSPDLFISSFSRLSSFLDISS